MSNMQKWLIVTIVAVLAGTWFFWFRHYLDKQKFERIEVVVEEITQRIVDEFDVEVVSHNNYCMYEGRKFGDGPLNCYSSRTINPKNTSTNNITNFVLAQSDLLNPSNIESRFELSHINSFCRISNERADSLYPLYLSEPFINNDAELLYFYCPSRASASHYQLIE